MEPIGPSVRSASGSPRHSSRARTCSATADPGCPEASSSRPRTLRRSNRKTSTTSFGPSSRYPGPCGLDGPVGQVPAGASRCSPGGPCRPWPALGLPTGPTRGLPRRRWTRCAAPAWPARPGPSARRVTTGSPATASWRGPSRPRPSPGGLGPRPGCPLKGRRPRPTRTAPGFAPLDGQRRPRPDVDLVAVTEGHRLIGRYRITLPVEKRAVGRSLVDQSPVPPGWRISTAWRWETPRSSSGPDRSISGYDALGLPRRPMRT